jgi:hydrogenase-1 operon protein HyaF
MSALQDLAVPVEAEPVPTAWGNALPVLHEIRHALERLVETGESRVIDLNAMPFGPGDERRLLELLGHGEIEARLNALGATEIRETAVPGVWLVDHRNAEGERLVLHVEIAEVPAILRTQAEDLREAVAALDARLAGGRESVSTAS